MDSRDLVGQMRQLGLWPQDDAGQRLAGALLRQHGQNATALARALLQRDLLTAYQANMLLTGKADRLLVGDYLVFERLGAGTMGQVYKARHRHHGRVVALKVLRREKVANRLSVERFFREIQVASRLTHPNLLRAFEAGQARDTYFFAMQYVRA